MGFLNKIFKKKPKNKKQYIDSDDSYLYSQVIYNGNYNFIILISFTQDKFFYVLENIMAYKHLNVIFEHSAYEKEQEPDTGTIANRPIIVNKRYYMLLAGSDEQYLEFINNTNMQNKVVKIVVDEILNHRGYTAYESLIDCSYVFKSQFAINQGKHIEFDSDVLYSGNIYGDDIDKIKTKLPDSFTAYDIINILKVYNKPKNISPITSFNLDTVYRLRNANTNRTSDDVYKSIYEDIKKNDFTARSLLGDNYTEYMIDNLLKPVYLQIDSDDYSIGDITDESLDDIFKNQYERFSAVYDETINYEDIDEVLSSEDIVGGEEDDYQEESTRGNNG